MIFLLDAIYIRRKLISLWNKFWSAFLCEFDSELSVLFSLHSLPSLICPSGHVLTEALLADTTVSKSKCQSAERGLFLKWCLPSFCRLLTASCGHFCSSPGCLSLILLRFCFFWDIFLALFMPGGHGTILSPVYQLILPLEFKRQPDIYTIDANTQTKPPTPCRPHFSSGSLYFLKQLVSDENMK